MSDLYAQCLRSCRSYFPLAAAASASSAPQQASVFGPTSATAKQPVKQPAGKETSAGESSSEGRERTTTNTTKASGFSFSSAFGEQQRSQAPAAAAPDPAKQELIRDTLANLAKLGYSGITEVDFGKLNPPDIYEDELQVMAEVRAYFQVAYKVRPPHSTHTTVVSELTTIVEPIASASSTTYPSPSTTTSFTRSSRSCRGCCSSAWGLALRTLLLAAPLTSRRTRAWSAFATNSRRRRSGWRMFSARSSTLASDRLVTTCLLLTINVVCSGRFAIDHL